MVAHTEVPLLPKLRGDFAEFLQHRSIKRLGILYQPTCVGFGYGPAVALFPGTIRPPSQSDKGRQRFTFVTSTGSRNINLFPIDYRFRPRLRGRLTLRGLDFASNLWDFELGAASLREGIVQ